jgi:hypothetical protein
MAALQIALDFGPPRPELRLDPAAERLRATRKLERQLSELMRSEVALSLTDNGRTMLSARHREGVAHVRLHHMFADADDSTLRAVARFLADGHGAASGLIQRFIRDHSDRIKRRVALASVSARGHHHDLHTMFAQVNARYFEGGVEARIGWARMGRALGRRRKRRSIKLGSYRGQGALIRVHPVLDAAWVPAFFVEYIVYHEMLHHVIAMPVENGRRTLHGPEFRARERQFERYDEAIAWERQNLDRLLSG